MQTTTTSDRPLSFDDSDGRAQSLCRSWATEARVAPERFDAAALRWLPVGPSFAPGTVPRVGAASAKCHLGISPMWVLGARDLRMGGAVGMSDGWRQERVSSVT